MVSTLAQLIALVSHGNAFLHECYEAQDFYPSNSAFRFCNKVSFVRPGKQADVEEPELAPTPNDWFAFLKRNDCLRLSLEYSPTSDPMFPDHKLAGLVGGGGTWYMASSFSGHADYWLARWEVTDRNAPDKRIWTVTYGRVAEEEKLPALRTDDISSYENELVDVLKRIEAFALKHDLYSWAKSFRDGIEALAADEPPGLTYHKDLLPGDGYSIPARRLMAACCQAWVFGGMGSWNDLGFEDASENEEYERLSRELYRAVNLSVERAANSYGQR
jgi:hypothetical protein